MCNVGGVSFFFFCGGKKKTKKFPSNLHCPVKKLNPFYFQFITIVSVWSSVFLHLLPTSIYQQLPIFPLYLKVISASNYLFCKHLLPRISVVPCRDSRDTSCSILWLPGIKIRKKSIKRTNGYKMIIKSKKPPPR